MATGRQAPGSNAAQGWAESGMDCGCRKLHDDLLEQVKAFVRTGFLDCHGLRGSATAPSGFLHPRDPDRG